MADHFEHLTVSDRAVAAELLLGTHVAAHVLSNVLAEVRPRLGPDEGARVSMAVASVIGGDLTTFHRRIVAQHPEFDAQDSGEFIRKVRAAGVTSPALWRCLDA